MIGEHLSPVLEEIEAAIWDYDEQELGPPGYTDGGFRAASKIFMSVLMDKIWRLQETEKMAMPDREAMATKAGQALRQLVKTYTDIDTFDLYK